MPDTERLPPTRESAAPPVANGGAATGPDLLARLRHDIVTNAFPPVAKLKFADLTARYGVGVGTLREALSHLVSEGFVTLDVGRGSGVAPVSLEDRDDVVSLFTEFETRALADSIRHGDDDWEAGVVASGHRLVLIHALPWEERMQRHGEWVSRHRDFHGRLVECCRSRWLLRLRAVLFDQLDRYRFLSKMHRGDGMDKGNEHRRIMEHALARDAEGACRLMEQHIRETADNVRRHLSADPD